MGGNIPKEKATHPLCETFPGPVLHLLDGFSMADLKNPANKFMCGRPLFDIMFPSEWKNNHIEPCSVFFITIYIPKPTTCFPQKKKKQWNNWCQVTTEYFPHVLSQNLWRSGSAAPVAAAERCYSCPRPRSSATLWWRRAGGTARPGAIEMIKRLTSKWFDYFWLFLMIFDDWCRITSPNIHFFIIHT